MSRPTYRAICERDGKFWFVRVPDVSGAFTQARRLDGVEEMAREVIALMEDVPADAFDVDVQVRLPEEVNDELTRARELRAQAEREQNEGSELMQDAARRLAEQGLTVRDVGRVLEVSFQRAQQLIGTRRSRTAA